MLITGRNPPPHSAEQGREMLNNIYEPWGLTCLEPLGFENCEFLVMHEEKARKLKIRTMSDLVDKSNFLTFAAPKEFFIRDWSFPLLRRRGIRFKSVREIPLNDRLNQVVHEEVDVGVAWTTDPEMSTGTLFRIQNDEHFPLVNQYAIPICRRDVAGVVAPALATLRINEKEIRKLNKDAGLPSPGPLLATQSIADHFLRRRRRRKRAQKKAGL